MLTNNFVYIHLNIICGRRLVDIERIIKYLQLNNYQITKDINKADSILFFGCAFHKHTEIESLKAIDKFKKYKKDLFIIGGIATMARTKLILQGFDNLKIITLQEFEKLDNFFGHKYKFKDIDKISKIENGKIINKYIVQVCKGCNGNCSFCEDKIIIGNINSNSIEKCISEIKKGLDLGYTNIELSGDDVGAYGIDLGLSIINLLNEIMKIQKDFNLFFNEINIKYLIKHINQFKDIFKYKKIKHLTIAFQSGNNRILNLMNRGYTKKEIRKLFKLLNNYPISLRFHAIIGFPTETFEEFKETLSLIIEGNFISGSIFKYSERKTTPSYKIFPKVTKDKIDKRIKFATSFLNNNGFNWKVLPSKIAITKRMKKEILFVSFYTEGIYEKVINDFLLPSLKKHNLPYKIYKKPNLKDWNKNTRFKAPIILEALETFKKDVVFIDADNVIEKFPELFYNIPQEYDVALFYLDWHLHFQNIKGNKKRELCNGVALFRNNEKVKKLIKEWIEKNKTTSGWEQKVLQDILEKHPEIKIYKLPVEYSVMPLLNDNIPKYIGTYIIRAYPFSRQIRNGNVTL